MLQLLDFAAGGIARFSFPLAIEESNSSPLRSGLASQYFFQDCTTESYPVTASNPIASERNPLSHSYIMSIQIPRNAGQFLGLGNNMESGLVDLGQSLGITQIMQAQFQGFLTAFSDADNCLRCGAQCAAGSADHRGSGEWRPARLGE